MEPFARIPGRYDDRERRAKVDECVGKRRHSSRIANLGTFTGYRIGLDIGNGNVGWCVLLERGPMLRFLTAEDIAAHNAALPKGTTRTQLPDLANFVPLGTHKFQAREPGEKAEKSFSKIRAEARAARGLLDARQRRRLHVHGALQNAGLMPEDGALAEGHTEIPADQLRVLLLNADFAAHPHDLGRALVNALKRRGYLKPVGRAGADEESGFGKRVEDDYRLALQRFECESVGQFLERCAQDAKKDGISFRKRHRSLAWQEQRKKSRPKDPATAKSYELFQFLTPTFGLICDEARLLRARQRHNVPIDEEHWAKIEEAAEFRRTLKAKTPWLCQFLGGKRRCVRALPSFQRFRILEQISNLRDRRDRPLDDATFGSAVGFLEGTEKKSVADLSRELGADRLRLTDEGEGKRMLVGAKTDLALSKLLGRAWTDLSLEERDNWTMRFLRRHWTNADGETPSWTKGDETTLQRDVAAAFEGKTLEEIDKEAGKTLREEDKFSSMSVEAAHIRAKCYAGRLSHDEHLTALAAAGAREPDLPLYERLPYYAEVMPDYAVPATGFAPADRTCAEELAHGRAANPDVHVVMNRIRAVVNAIIKMMGGILPTTCVVEVARSALSEEAANQHTQRARERERLREMIVADIERVYTGIDQRLPRGPGLDRLVDRWKAAIRQGWRDYNGESIARSNLIDSALYQLDHISPAAFGEFRENNLFVSRFNQSKGRRLPWQAFGEDSAFAPALLAFATFGIEQRIGILKKALASKRAIPHQRRARLESALGRAERQRNRLHEVEREIVALRPDVLAALERTLTTGLGSLLHEDATADVESTRRGAPRSFEAGDQAALFCRFHPDAQPPEREFAARDVANIGWSTKLAIRYLAHLGAEVVAIKPWAIHALRCMLELNKERADLRNHAIDAFLIAHFDARVLRPAFNCLRGGYEALYQTRALRLAVSGVAGGDGFLEELMRGVDRLERVLPTIATAHRADNRWNPDDRAGNSVGRFGGENIYSFRPTRRDREMLSAIVARENNQAVEGRVMTRDELLTLLSSGAIDENRRNKATDKKRRELYERLRNELFAAFAAEAADKKMRKLGEKMRKQAKVRYRTRIEAKAKTVETTMQAALPLPDQPGAFIDAAAKFAIIGPSAFNKRRIVDVALFSRMKEEERRALFVDGQPILRRGDTVIEDGRAYVISGLEADGRVTLYPVDAAMKEKKDRHRPTIPESNKKPIPLKFSSDVLGRRLHRLRKDPGGLQPMYYPLRDK